MNLRVAGTIAATCLLAASTLHAQTITWTGSGGDGNVFTSGNWGASTYLGNGSQSLNFGNAGASAVTITTSTANNIDFASPRAAYTFSGTGAGQVLTLNGYLGVNADVNAVVFDSSFELSLSTGDHSFYVSGPSNQFSIAGPITGAGKLVKEDTGTLILSGANTQSGGTTINDGTLAVTGSINHSASDLILNAGALLINSGGDVTNGYGHIGISSAQTGLVTVSGAGSTWANTIYLFVGEAGTGTVNIQSGAQVTNFATSIGNNAGGTGTVNVDGAGSKLTNSDYVFVGSEGTGYLNVTNGAVVQTNGGSIGNNLGGHGTMLIDGVNSAWTSTDTIFVGAAGTGLLTVSNHGTLSSTAASLGNNAGGDGTVTVTGAGSSWTNTGNMFVGAFSNGSLDITSGASVSSVNTTVGNNTTGIGTVAVSGSGSALTISGDLRVGWQGTGTLEVQNGAGVSTATAKVGENSGATGTVLVHGAGSTLTVSGSDLSVGYGGTGILYLYDQGTVNVGGGSGTLNLGHSSGGAGVLKIGTDGTGYFPGGIVNAAEIKTGAGLSGELKFATTGTAANPYYLTKDGLSDGASVLVSGPTEVQQLTGFTVLKSANTYTGATYISGGTLIASDQDALGGIGPVTVNGGTLVLNAISLYNPLTLASGTLAGNGYAPTATIGANFTLAPGLPATGGRIGALNFDHLELASGGTMEWNLQNPTGGDGAASTNWDKVNVITSATLDITATTGSKFTLKLISLDINGGLGTATGFVPGQAYQWLVFESDGTLNFDPLKFNLDLSQFVTDSVDIANISLTNTGNNLYLNFTPVPEPSTYALLALGLAGTALAAWRRHRRI